MDISPIRLQRRYNRLTGEDLVPANEAAELICALTQTRYMTKGTVSLLKQYNIHVVVEAEPERVL